MRSTTRLAAVLTAASVAAACTSTEPPADDGPPVGVAVTDAAPPAPVRIDETPVWTDSANPLFTSTYAVTLHEDTALLVGDAPDGVAERLAAVSLPDGQVRWQLDAGAVLPGAPGLILVGDTVGVPGPRVGGTGADWFVLATYSTDPVGTRDPVPHGLAALSGRDGTVRWTAPLDATYPEEDRLFTVDATEDVVVAARAPADSWNKSPATGGNPGTVVALDATDGTRRWERAGLAPTGIAGDVLVGTALTNAVGLDLESGTELWELPDSPPFLVSGDLALVGRPHAALVDARTGTDVDGGDLGAPPLTCAADDTMVACVASESPSWLVTFQPKRGRVEAAELAGAPHSVPAVAAGRVFLLDTSSKISVLDTAGTRLTEDWPAAPVALSDGYVAFRTDEGVSIHRLG